MIAKKLHTMHPTLIPASAAHVRAELGADAATPATVVAAGGYLGPPTDAGVVEIGYSVCPEWRGLGYATEIAGALAAHAARQPGVTAIIAHTTAVNPASVRVLERSGFAQAGPGAEPGTLRFEYAPATT